MFKSNLFIELCNSNLNLSSTVHVSISNSIFCFSVEQLKFDEKNKPKTAAQNVGRGRGRGRRGRGARGGRGGGAGQVNDPIVITAATTPTNTVGHQPIILSDEDEDDLLVDSDSDEDSMMTSSTSTNSDDSDGSDSQLIRGESGAYYGGYGACYRCGRFAFTIFSLGKIVTWVVLNTLCNFHIFGYSTEHLGRILLSDWLKVIAPFHLNISPESFYRKLLLHFKWEFFKTWNVCSLPYETPPTFHMGIFQNLACLLITI